VIHEMEFRVAYADTDRMGVVYYANYLILFERGRTELLRGVSLRYRDFEEALQVFLPAVEANLHYLSPARYDDLLKIRTWVSAIGRASVTFSYEVVNAETTRVITQGITKHPFVNRDWKPVPVPASVRPVLLRILQPASCLFPYPSPP